MMENIPIMDSICYRSDIYCLMDSIDASISFFIGMDDGCSEIGNLIPEMAD